MAESTQDSKRSSFILAAPDASESTAHLCEEHELFDMQQEENKNGNPRKKEDETEYPPTWRVALTMVGVCFAMFCMSLDNTILATAVPKITSQFNSLEDVGWYGSAYLLTICGLNLVFGKLYTFYSIKIVYLIALAVFEVGSLICGAAPNSLGLILGRAVAGAGGAGLYSGAIVIITQSMPLDRRPLYTGLLGAVYGVAGVAGPLLGGAFTDYVSWRWCFYINLPFGGVTAVVVMWAFHAKSPIKATTGMMDQIAQLDLVGLAVFMPAIICLLLALQWGGAEYSWGSGRVIGLLVTFGVLLGVYIAMQWWKQDQATVPPRLVKNRNVWGPAVISFCISAALMVLTYYLPIWFQSIKNVSAMQSGLMNLPTIIATVTASLLSGTLVNIFGYYTPFMYVSPILAAIGAGLLSTLTPTSGHAEWIGYQALFGLGVGTGTTMPLVAVQAALDYEDIPSATVIMMFMQTFGGALLVSVAQNIFQTLLVRNLARDAPGVDAAEIITAGATKIRDVVPAEMLSNVLVAYNDAITRSFYAATALSALAIVGALPVQWISVKKNKRGKSLDGSAI
ncbi:major facilitator superfamily domain-containing protein [Aspergillus californicus]